MKETLKTLFHAVESFTHEIKELSKEEVLNERSNAYEFADFEEKQETLEEFISKSDTPKGLDQFSYDKGLGDGAEWQAKNMYNEEDLKEAFKQSRQAKIFEKDMPPVWDSFENWFEQFSKLKNG